MGMDYVWSGSASYPRFHRELTDVAELFGGVSRIRYPWFVFPPETNDILVKWFNLPYEDFTAEETKILWELISAHPEIEEISYQIWNELRTCVELETSWHIY